MSENQMTLEELIKLTEIPLLVKFSAVWCSPCKVLQPILEDLAMEWEGDIDFWEVDVDDDPETATNWSVRSIPTLILIDTDGTELERITGVQTRSSLLEMLYRHFEDGMEDN